MGAVTNNLPSTIQTTTVRCALKELHSIYLDAARLNNSVDVFLLFYLKCPRYGIIKCINS